MGAVSLVHTAACLSLHIVMTFTLNAGLHHCDMHYFTVSLSASQHATHCCYPAKSKEALSFVAVLCRQTV